MKFNHHIYAASGFKWLVGCILVLLSLGGCKKAVDIGAPVDSLVGDNVYTSNGSAESVLSGLFSGMTGSYIYNGSGSISLSMGLSADELVSYGNGSITNNQFYTNNLTSLGGNSDYFWSAPYSLLYTCNTTIKGLASAGASGLNPAIKQQLLGEAKFSRAFIYFYQVNLYGNIPMPVTNDYAANNTIASSPVAAVYQQVIADLKDAQGLLSDGKYLTGTGTATTDRVRPNKQAATALLARAYLYTKDWQNAEQQASAVINTPIYVLEPNLSQAFLKATREAIWQLQPSIPGANNNDTFSLVVTDNPLQSLKTMLPLSASLVSAFEPGDARFTNWVGQFNVAASQAFPAATYYFANKYRANTLAGASTAPVTEYPVVLRLAEQYLIRAEARAQQNNISGAQADLNVVRARAGLAATTASTQSDLLTAIAHERQVELFTEFGHRWFDLRRTNKIDEVMSTVTPQKGGGSWNTNKQLVPVPTSEILINPNITQNPGY